MIRPGVSDDPVCAITRFYVLPDGRLLGTTPQSIPRRNHIYGRLALSTSVMRSRFGTTALYEISASYAPPGGRSWKARVSRPKKGRGLTLLHPSRRPMSALARCSSCEASAHPGKQISPYRSLVTSSHVSRDIASIRGGWERVCTQIPHIRPGAKCGVSVRLDLRDRRPGMA